MDRYNIDKNSTWFSHSLSKPSIINKGAVQLKKLLIFISSFVLLLTSCVPQPNTAIIDDITIEERISQYIADLTSEEMAGRRVGTEGEKKAALYIAEFFKEAGLEPAGDQGTYFQTFPIGRYEPVMNEKRVTLRSVVGEGAQAENVLGILPGKEKGYIVVSAHYDHLGIINGKVYPGANDNASGVAAVLELVRELKGRKPAYSILFAMWSGEEAGLSGSEYFCNNPTVPLRQIKAVINLDCIGYIQEDKEILGWTTKENKTSRSLVRLIEQKGWKFIWEEPKEYNSDQASFNKHGVAGFTILSPDWLNRNHTLYDVQQRIRTESIADLVETVKKVLFLVDR